MSRPRLRALLIALACLIAPALAAHSLVAGPQFQYPPTAGAVTTYATPSLLAAGPISGLTAGATAATTYQGMWSYQPACPAFCDGAATCVTAAGVDGGMGCWMRNPGGVPGATTRSYYSDSILGNDANDCLVPGAASSPGGHGACLTFGEPWRRVGSQTFDGTISPQPVFYLTGDFSSESVNIQVYMANGSYPTIQGTRSYVGSGIGVDGGGYNGFVSAAVNWDGGAHQEGVYTVSAASDGGALFPFSGASTPDSGLMLELTTGPNAGANLIIGDPRDAGGAVFASPGGIVESTFSGVEPTAGTGVRLYRPTHIDVIGANQPVMISVHGDGTLLVQDVDLGPFNNAAHSVSVIGDGIGSAVVPLASTLRGVDQQPGSNLQPLGSTLARLTVYGYTYCSASLLAGHVRPNLGGNLQLGDHCMIVGDASGGIGQPTYTGANVTVTGESMVANYTSTGGVLIDYPGTLSVVAPLWVWGAPSSSGPAYVLQSGTLSTYASGFAPAATGTQSGTPLKLAGTSYALSSLPLAGFVVLQ